MKACIICILLMMQLAYACKKSGMDNARLELVSGKTYYVDAQNGDDTKSGTSEALAWKTLSKVNATTFQPGDSLLLKRGSVWAAQLYPKGNGTATNPITIGAYGTGNRPLIALGGTVGGAVYLFNQSNWTIQHLEVTNQASSRGTTFRSGILVQNEGGGIVSNIRILDNYVHNVSGTFRYGAFDPHAFGGISLVTTGTAGADKFDNILIQENRVEAAGRTGIVVWDNVWSGAGQASENVKIRQNTVKDIDSDGILTFGCNGALVEYNVANTCGNYAELGQFNGSCAIWCTRGADCVVQYNEAYNTQALMDNADGQAFDLDYDAVRGVVQYNYSHDNAGGFVLFINGGTTTNNCIVRYNISQNDKRSLITFAGGVAPNSQIYNNTFYIKAGLNTNIIDHSWDLDMTPAYAFKNNIVYNLGSGVYKIPGTNGAFDYNHYYGNHPVSEPAELHKLTTDPLLVNPGGGGTGIATVDGYQLRAGSPALNTGVAMPGNGGKDYWGNVILAAGAPNRGAFNGAGITGLP
ncbi:right-handed parallel beta-helix repeat-containing protein [Chitinophaga defluvii]|uniref:Right-handed parallel beta-helix repeat-containing protein n=1 Tax=Chitinophaga defluvii TaxID=3163343 RepID=A0ABV2TBQ5_9BACT